MSDASTARAIEALAAAIGDNVYLDVAKWHLYLRDAKLHTPLAEKLYPLVVGDKVTDAAVTDILAGTPVAIGGGQKTVTLADLVPAASKADLLEAIADYQRDL
ncbi:thylakoid-associated protein [filamentous cyanobacterium CCT1]|nr:thylakoid-associated protein [filamentous cyanobacterium CCT1]PSN78112.1 thylakoid-associated protein [filamentous cyanobacterium CCP4]